MNVQALFHLAFPVRDLTEARAFYAGLLGCPEGRSSPHWIDFNFFGHQLVAHLSPGGGVSPSTGTSTSTGTSISPSTSEVDGKAVPLRHFGAVLAQADWEALAARLVAADTRFLITPQLRFEGQAGEQSTMFFLDPSGNALEFKAFADIGQLFAR